MGNRYKSLFLGVLVMVFLTGFIFAGDSHEKEMKGESGFVKEFVGMCQFVEGRLVDLANAISPKKYEWRPDKGVRSISEVYRHITFANYNFGKMSEVDPSSAEHVAVDRQKFEIATTDKEQVVKDLKKSFEVLRNSAAKITDQDLEKQVTVFGMEMSLRQFMALTLNHIHEHYGQSIAYARMNKIVPPWSVKAEKAEN